MRVRLALCFATFCFVVTAAVSAEQATMNARDTFEHDGEQIYYETYGSGEPIVFCHGLGGNHAIWYQQVYPFAQQYQVITWDHRGFGRSTNLNEQSGPEAAARDLKALLDHLDIDKAHLVGQSMGGWTVMGFALDNPERVLSLTFADTLAGIYTPETAAAFDTYIRSRFSAPPRSATPFGSHPAIGETHAAENPTHAFLYEQIGSSGPPPPAPIAKALRDTAFDLDRVAAITAPTLFVVGSEDPIFVPSAIRVASEQISGSRLVEIPDAGHSPYFEMPEAWNAAVLEFVGAAAR